MPWTPDELFGSTEPRGPRTVEDLFGPSTTTPEPPEEEPLFKPRSMVREKIGEAVGSLERGAFVGDPAKLREVQRAVRAIQDPELRRRSILETQKEAKTVRQIQSAAPKILAQARHERMPKEAARAGEAIRAMRAGEAEPPSGVLETLKQGGRLLFKGLDVPGRIGRAATMPGGDLFDWQAAEDPTEWNRRMREAADRGELGAKGFVGLTDVAAAMPGALLGANIAGFGALTDIAAGKRPTLENAQRTIRETTTDVGDFLRTAAVDPLTYFSGGTSPTKSAVSVAGRTAAKAGLDTAAIRGVEREVAEVMSRVGGTARAPIEVEETMRRAGIPAEAIRDAFGSEMQFLGRGQMRLGVPLTEKGIDVLPALTGREYAGGKALEATVGKVASDLGRGRPLFSQEAAYAKTETRQARALEAALQRRGVLELEQLATIAPSKERRIDLLHRHIDPDYDMLPLRPGEDISGAKLIEHEGVTYTVRPKTDYIPLADLTDQERAWVEGVQDFFEGQRKQLVDAGVLAPNRRAFNPLSDQYIPRIYKGRFAALEEVVPLEKGQGGYRFQKARKDIPLAGSDYLRPGGVPLGAAEQAPYDYLVAKMDPHDIFGVSLQQNARAVARAGLERSVIEHFKANMPGISSGMKRGWKRLDLAPNADDYAAFLQGNRIPANEATVARLASMEPKEARAYMLGLGIDGGAIGQFLAKNEVAVPAHVWNMIQGTFDQQYATFGKAVRQALGDSHPRIRAVTHLLDGYAALVNRFKRLVLIPVPRYHIINVWNDGMQMAAAGMNDPRYIAKAHRVLSGKGKVAIGGVTYDAADLLRKANEHNIALDAMFRADLYGGDVALSSLGKRLSRIQAGKHPEGALRGAQRYGERFARFWENHSKLAMFLYGIGQGDSPALAAKRSFDVLMDYGDRSKELQMLRWFLPFATWLWKAPEMAARLVAKRPGRVVNVDRFLKELGADEEAEPRRYVTERGTAVTTTPRGHEIVGNIRQAFGGSPTDPGTKSVVLPRMPFDEALNPLTQAIPGVAGMLGIEGGDPRHLDPLVQQLGPAAKALYEMRAREDILTKQPLEQSPALRYIPPFVANPLVLHAANRLVNEGLYGGEGPISTFGGYRPYAQGRPPSDIYAHQLMNMLLGFPAYEVMPQDALWNLTHEPAAKETIRAPAEIERIRKDIRQRKRSR